MLSRLREPFGKAGLIVAIVALVASLAGGAYAAQSDSSGDATASKNKRNHKKGKRNKKKKQKGVTVAQVRKIAKQEARKFANSNPGPAGPQGPAGANGNDGQNGSDGAPGKNGESVTLAAATGCGVPGGTKLSVGASSQEVCNGEDGETGFTATLPPGESETGVWGHPNLAESSTLAYDAFSFPIPLADGVVPALNVIEADGTAVEGSTANCPGTSTEPSAEPGNLCVYVDPATSLVTDGIENVEPFLNSRFGVVAEIKIGKFTILNATWVVRAPVA